MTDHRFPAPFDLEMAPLISTTTRGGRITRVAPGRPVGRFDGQLLAHLVAGGTAWAAAASVPFGALLGLAPTTDADGSLSSPWATGAAIALTVAAIALTVRLRACARASFGQARVTHLVSSLAVTGGLATSAAAWFVAGLRFDHPPFDLGNIATSATVPRELGVAVGAAFAAWTAVTMILLAVSVRGARSQQHRFNALHRSGDRHEGVLDSVHFRRRWLREQPEFTIEVSYTAADGPHRLTTNLLTDAWQVPVEGSPMIVLTDGHGRAHVDLDHAAGITYLADRTLYEASRD